MGTRDDGRGTTDSAVAGAVELGRARARMRTDEDVDDAKRKQAQRIRNRRYG